MSETESVLLEDRVAALEKTLHAVGQQLQLAVQMCIRHELTISQMTKGQFVMQTAKDGFSDKVNDIPVQDNAPLYRLVPTAQATTRIVTTGSLPTNGHGRIH